jgi:hypothetical protein
VWRRSTLLELSMGRLRGSTLVSESRRALPRLLPHHHSDGNMDRAVKYWRKACLLACLDHTVLLLSFRGLKSIGYCHYVEASYVCRFFKSTRGRNHINASNP